MSLWKLIRRDKRGAAAIEMAFALPILLIFVYGIFQFGVILQANAGMQHALGEGARLATLCTPSGTTCQAPSDTAIAAKMSNEVFGMNVGTFGTPTVSIPATTVCTNCRLLSVTYSVTPDFLFFSGPAISLTRTKQVYIVA